MAKTSSLGDAMVSSYENAAGTNATATRKKVTGHKLESINIECTDNGGYSVRINHGPKDPNASYGPGSHISKTHVFEDQGSLFDFLEAHLGVPDESKDDQGA